MGQERTAKTSRPDVIVDFIFDNGLFFISVENIGDRPALNVKTVFGHRLMGLHGTKEISALPLFHNIEFLAPRKSIKTLLDSSTSYFSRGEPTRLSVKITYTDAARKRYTATIHHDLGIYRDIAYVSSSNQRNLIHEEQS